MKLYSGPLSLFSRKVEIALAEKGIAHDREVVTFSQSTGYAPKHPAVLAGNPKGQVPVLVDGDLTLFDSTVILEYLEEGWPDPALMPTEPKARARCRLLELTADEILLKPLSRLMFRTEPARSDPAEEAKLEAAAAVAEDDLLALYRGLARDLRGDWFCERYSMADIALFMSVHYGGRLGAPSLDSLPALALWYWRMLERPAVASVVAEIDEADRRLSRPVTRRM
ncbi:glutathione S-transferase family protein [Thalassobaculum sp.]|uniref:glutathione S-transferase family protein n=1 Tax=Thalassobaculum sp. TaxID=2022740 RepID=UPI003B5A5D80